MKKLRNNHFVMSIIMMLLFAFVVIPFVLMIPPIKETVVFLLSFTDTPEYKAVYVELWGAIIGSFIAIYGALWVERKKEEKESRATIARYACIVYYDLYFFCEDFTAILNGVAVEDYCDVLMEKQRFYVNKNWIADVAQLNTALCEKDLKFIYRCYEYLTNINWAIQLKDKEAMRKSCPEAINCFLSDDKKEQSIRMKEILNLLSKLMKVDGKNNDDESDQKKVVDHK